MITSTEFFQTLAADGFKQSGTQYDGAVSPSATFTTAAMFVGTMRSFLVILSASSPAVGSVKLQICIDKALRYDEKPDEGLTTWIDWAFTDPLTGVTAVDQAVTGPQDICFNEPNCTARWIRLVYTRTSGTAPIKIRAQLKGASQ